jgi:transcriptional regulator with XRE-family HTH domain
MNLRMADGERAERLGEIIRRQRELSALSMRQFADLVGISNPYLSQIERGLREPSERVLEGIARSLRVPVDALYEQAGLRVDEEEQTPAVVEAIRADPQLTGRQRQAMLEVYRSFTAPAHAPRRGGRSRSDG